MNVYPTYRFMPEDKDPAIGELQTILQNLGMFNKAGFTTIQDRSNVKVATLNAWFFGKTRRPQSATLEAVGRAAGQKRVWVAYHPRPKARRAKE